MAESVTITLPLPDARLHAHAKGNWRPKAAATKSLRELAHALAMVASRRRRPQWESATLHVLFCWKDNRRRDQANALQSLKPAIDGLVDAGIIVDDCWQVLRIGSIDCVVDRSNPRVELTLERRA